MDKTAVAVGDSTRLEVIFATDIYRGPIHRHVKIFTNVSDGNEIVSITTLVTSDPERTYYPLVIAPPDVFWASPAGPVCDSTAIELTNRSDTTLNLFLVTVPDDLVEVILPESLDAEETAEGFIRLRAQAMAESFEKSITFEVDDAEATRFTIPAKRLYQEF